MSWPEIKFESLQATPSRNGVYKSKEFHGRGSRIVNMGELFGYNFISNQDMKRVELSERELESNSLEDGDLLFGRRSLVEAGAGKCSLVLAPMDSLTFESSIIRVRLNKAVANPRFLYYYFQSPEGRGRIQSIVSGTNVKGIRGSDLKQLPVAHPSKAIQDEISRILTIYDDLIENNRRRMALLEESARLLYREWFVLLRFPGYEHTTIVDGVPQGWKRKALSQLTSFLKRGITPKYDDDAEGLVINQKCIRDGRVNLELARKQSKEVKPERVLQVGDVLVNSTGEGTLGRVAQVKASLTNCTVDTHVTIVRPKTDIGRHYFGQAVMDWEPRFSTMGKGATNQTELSPTAIGETTILVPSQTLLEQFESFTDSLYEQVSNLTGQTQKLRSARDILLPRLMRGELTV
jgi:type I restriction enzyme S subunit